MRFGRKDEREQLVSEMVDEAEALRGQPGGVPRALRLLERASDIVAVLASEYPEDLRHLRQLGSMQYTLAAIQRQTGGFQESLAACDVAEQAYRALGERSPETDVDALLADVRVRRAMAHAAAGNAASALSEGTAGLSIWLGLTGEPDTSPRRLDLARVLSMNAVILARWGDPDLAVASADQAIRIYIADRPTATQFALPSVHHRYLGWACAVAGSRHAQHGRIDVALYAANLRLRLFDAAAHPEVDRAHAQLDALPEQRQRAFGQRVAERLRQVSAPTRALTVGPMFPPDPDLDEVVEIMTHLGDLAETPLGRQLGLRPVQPPAPLQRLTLRAALERCTTGGIAPGRDVDGLLSRLTAPALDCTILSPAHRTGMRGNPMAAYQLAMLVPPARDLDPIVALRLALEAHAMLAFADENRHPAIRTDRGQLIKPAWATALLTGSRIAAGLNLTSLALDLAAWACGVAESVAPFAILDTDLAAQIRAVIHWHADMLDRAGRPADAAQARQAAAGFSGPPQ
jgi:hypothetical protein